MICVHTDDFSPSQIGVHTTRMSQAIDPLEDRRPVVALPAVLGHVGPHAGCDVVVDGPDLFDCHALARHDLRGDVYEALGVRLLRRALQRAVDEDGTQVAEIPRVLRAQLFLLGVQRHVRPLLSSTPRLTNRPGEGPERYTRACVTRRSHLETMRAVACSTLTVREGSVDMAYTAEEKAFLESHVWAVLATGRRDGSPQQAMVGYTLDGDGRLLISTRTPTARVAQHRAEPAGERRRF